MGPYLGNLKGYTFGFIFSLVLTLLSYALVAFHLLPKMALSVTIPLLALAQVWCQLIVYLSLLKEGKLSWSFLIFLFLVVVSLILVAGSVWIMKSLDYNLMGT